MLVKRYLVKCLRSFDQNTEKSPRQRPFKTSSGFILVFDMVEALSLQFHVRLTDTPDADFSCAVYSPPLACAFSKNESRNLPISLKKIELSDNV